MFSFCLWLRDHGGGRMSNNSQVLLHPPPQSSSYFLSAEKATSGHPHYVCTSSFLLLSPGANPNGMGYLRAPGACQIQLTWWPNDSVLLVLQSVGTIPRDKDWWSPLVSKTGQSHTKHQPVNKGDKKQLSAQNRPDPPSAKFLNWNISFWKIHPLNSGQMQ